MQNMGLTTSNSAALLLTMLLALLLMAGTLKSHGFPWSSHVVQSIANPGISPIFSAIPVTRTGEYASLTCD